MRDPPIRESPSARTLPSPALQSAPQPQPSSSAGTTKRAYCPPLAAAPDYLPPPLLWRRKQSDKSGMHIELSFDRWAAAAGPLGGNMMKGKRHGAGKAIGDHTPLATMGAGR